VASRLGTFGGTVSGSAGRRCSTAKPRRWSSWVRWGCDAIGPCGNEVAGSVVNAPFRRHLSAPTRCGIGGVGRHRAGLSVGVPPDTIAPQAPHLKLLGAGPFPCLSNATTTARGTLKSASSDRYISVVNTDTAQWSRPDLLCLVAGLGVVAVEEQALLGSCDRRTAVGRSDYAVITRSCGWAGAPRGRGPPPARTCTPSAKAQKQRSLRPRSPEVGRDPQSTKFTEQHQLPRSDQRSDPQSTCRQHHWSTAAPQELDLLPGLLTVLARSDITGLKRIITLSAGATQFRGPGSESSPCLRSCPAGGFGDRHFE
jgi:hypothetical protein